MSVGTNGEAKNMGKRGRKASLAQPVTVGTRVERETRDGAKSLGLNQSEILREALEQAVEVAMRELNYQHPEEIPQVEHSTWLSNLKWW
jgi:hypothetical protein